jgi:hypothetical protein
MLSILEDAKMGFVRGRRDIFTDILTHLHGLVCGVFMAFFVVSLELAGRNCLNGEKSRQFQPGR